MLCRLSASSTCNPLLVISGSCFPGCGVLSASVLSLIYLSGSVKLVVSHCLQEVAVCMPVCYLSGGPVLLGSWFLLSR